MTRLRLESSAGQADNCFPSLHSDDVGAVVQDIPRSALDLRERGARSTAGLSDRDRLVIRMTIIQVTPAAQYCTRIGKRKVHHSLRR